MSAAVEIAPKRSDGNPSGEPENHGHSFERKHDIFVSHAWEVGRRENEEGDDKQCPYGAEEHEIDAVKGIAAPGGGELVDDYSV